MNRLCWVACSTTVLVTSICTPARAAVTHVGPHARSLAPAASIHDRMVDIRGHSLFLRCMGTGPSTVVLDDAGVVEAWMTVQPGIADFARVCTYDRAGLGMSEPGPTPTSTGQLTRDLHALLKRARTPGPYVLVGHAFGGDTARLFASMYPRDTKGLVLVDAIPPAVLSHRLIANGDDVNVPKSRRDVQSAGSLKNLPLIVLAHGVPYSYSASVERRWLRLQRRFAGLSSRSLFVVTRSGQNMPAVLPEVVVDAVRAVVVEAGRHSS